MQNKVYSSLLALALMGAYLTPTALEGETVGQEQRPITVKYKTGEVERYIVRWTGTVEPRKWEDGHPAEPFNGWITDTRQCHWQITSQVLRKLYFINKHGEEFAKDDFTRPFSVGFENNGSDFVFTQLRPENCGDANARYESDLRDARSHTNGTFKSVIDADYKSVQQTMRQWPDVSEVLP